MAGRRAALWGGGVLLAVLGLGYGASFLLFNDEVPRGVHVRGVDLSGLSVPEARALLSRELADDAARPLELVADDVRMTLAPIASGLRVDVEATVDEATSAGPLDRLRGVLGARRNVEPEGMVREEVLSTVLRAFAPKVDRP